MNITHVDLHVSDVAGAREFFERWFGLRCIYQRAKEIALLEGDAGFSLGVSNLRGSPPPPYPPDFHVGFMLQHAADVRGLCEAVKAGGVRMTFDLAEAGPVLVFRCLGPDGIPVEVRAPLGPS